MNKNFIHRLLTFVLISCMLIQMFPMHLKAENSSKETEEQTSEQIQETTESFDSGFDVSEEETEEVIEEVTEETTEEESEEISDAAQINVEEDDETEEPLIEVVEDGITYLFFGSNYDKNESTLAGLLNTIETDAEYEAVDYVGLTGTFVMDSTDDVFLEVTGAHERLNSATVDLLTSDESLVVEDTASILNQTSGLLYTDENVYVYGITEKSLSEGTTSYDEIQDFKNWAAASDSSKVLVVLAETAIHAGIETNQCAEDWHNVLNEVAMTDGKVTRDVVVLYGDAAESLYLPVGSDMTVQGYGKTVDSQIQYTYLSNGNLSADHAAVLFAADEEYVSMFKCDADAEEAEFLGEVERYVEPVAKLQRFDWIDDLFPVDYLYATTTAIEMFAADAFYSLSEEIQSIMSEDYFAYSIDFSGYESGTEIYFELPVPEYVSNANFVVYMIHQDNSLTEITDYERNNGYVKFTENEPGTFVYGTKNVNIPETAELTGLSIVSLPKITDYSLVNGGTFSLDTDGLKVIAEFTDETGIISKEIEWEAHVGGEYSINYDATKVGKVEVDVTYTYGEVTLMASFMVNVSYANYTDDSKVSLTFENLGVTNVEVKENTKEFFVEDAVDSLLTNYKSYDISVEGHKKGDMVQVTLPVPAGVEHPQVYYINEAYKSEAKRS